MSKNVLLVPHTDQQMTLQHIHNYLVEFGESTGKLPTQISLSIDNYVGYLHLLRSPIDKPTFHGIPVKMRPRKEI